MYGIYLRPLVPGRGPDLPPGYSSRTFDEDDAEALFACADNPALGLTASFVRAALAKGDACDAVLHHGKVVAYDWLAFSATHDSEGVYVDFGKTDRYGYKAFTLPEYRGKHLRRVPRSNDYCIARGVTHVISFVDVTNRSSIRSTIGRGSVRIGFAGYLKRGRVFVPFRTPAVRRRGFRFFVPRDAAV